MAHKLEKLVTFDGMNFRVFFTYSPPLVTAVKKLPRRRFDNSSGTPFWQVFFDKANIPAFPEFIAREGFTVEADAAEKLRELTNEFIAAPPPATQTISTNISTVCD